MLKLYKIMCTLGIIKCVKKCINNQLCQNNKLNFKTKV